VPDYSSPSIVKTQPESTNIYEGEEVLELVRP
jgi:hypothetical protein